MFGNSNNNNNPNKKTTLPPTKPQNHKTTKPHCHSILQCTFWAKQLVRLKACVSSQIASDYGTDPAITSLLNTLDVFLLPVTNPDGYVFSQTSVSR
jgi:murein tripeptide amidase MpaA